MKPISEIEMAARAKVGAKPRFTRAEVYALRRAYKEEHKSIRALRRETGANYATVVDALQGKGAYKDV